MVIGLLLQRGGNAMSEKHAANRQPGPGAGRLLPPIVAVSAVGGAEGGRLPRCRAALLRGIGQEQTYSRRLLDNERQQVRARYERLKQRASRIRSNLTPEQIAEIRRGTGEGGGGGGGGGGGDGAGAEGGEVSGGGGGTVAPATAPPGQGARQTAQRGGRRVTPSAGVGSTGPSPRGANGRRASAGAGAAGTARPGTAAAQQAEPVLSIQTPVAMGLKRGRVKTAAPAKPDAIKAGHHHHQDAAPVRRTSPASASAPLLAHHHSRQTQGDGLHTGQPASSTPTIKHALQSATATTITPIRPEEGDTRKLRAATIAVCASAESSSGIDDDQEFPDSEGQFYRSRRRRSLSAAGRLQSSDLSPTRMPAVTEEVRLFGPPRPPSRPKSSTCLVRSTAAALTPKSPRCLLGLYSRRTGRSASAAVAPPVPPCPGAGGPRQTSPPAHQHRPSTVRSPGAAAAEPPAAFSCHEPRLEDLLAQQPAALRRMSSTVSPFHESRARKREELREARLGDNHTLAAALEQRKERLMRGLEDIVGHPQEDESVTPVGSPSSGADTASPPSSPPVRTTGDQEVADEAAKIEGEEDPLPSWHQEMMKIRYLRLPKDYDEAASVSHDSPTIVTVQPGVSSQFIRRKKSRRK